MGRCRVDSQRAEPLDDANLRNFVQTALQDSHLPAAGTTVRVRWSGREHGQARVVYRGTARPRGDALTQRPAGRSPPEVRPAQARV